MGALAFWFWTQALLGSRAPQGEGIVDALHLWTANWNSYLLHHASAANSLLIISSALIDAIGIFLLLRWLIGSSVRPFLGLVMVLLLRQVMQVLCALPAPQGMIWHYPGVPSLLVTYSVSSDFFFSGHTAIAVFGATEIARLRNPWLTALAVLVVLFEIAAVILLRAHYTMDTFTGLIAALWVAAVVERLSIPVDRFLFGAARAK
jgi:hypothetical protein